MKSCRKPGTNSTLPCKCQWLCNMKAYAKKMEEKCNSNTEAPEVTKTYEDFCTDSTYEGEWREGYGMHGFGVYTFAHGVVYEGEFKDGAMHGIGELRYKTPDGTAAIRGQWNNGKMTERTVIFDDIVDYDEDDWKYCKMPDRRFAVEYANGLLPGGKSHQTPNQPTLKVPIGYCDTLDGYYDRKRRVVVHHEDAAKLVRGVSSQERRWIETNCRLPEETLNVGPRQDLYEEYVEPTQYLEPPQAPAANTRLKLEHEFSEISLGRHYNAASTIVGTVPKTTVDHKTHLQNPTIDEPQIHDFPY